MLLDAAGGVPEIRQSRCRLLNYILLHFNPVLKNQGKQMNAFTRAWHALERHYQDTRHVLLRDRFACEPDRFERMHERLDGMLFDYSKNRLGEDTLQLLCNLADAADLEGKMRALRTGAKVNNSEGRAALHTALRLPDGAGAVYADGRDVLPEIRRELNRALEFAHSLDDGSYQGITGKRITDFVHIGIGGSDLGPAMCVQALEPFRRHIASILPPTPILPAWMRFYAV